MRTRAARRGKSFSRFLLLRACENSSSDSSLSLLRSRHSNIWRTPPYLCNANCARRSLALFVTRSFWALIMKAFLAFSLSITSNSSDSLAAISSASLRVVCICWLSEIHVLPGLGTVVGPHVAIWRGRSLSVLSRLVRKAADRSTAAAPGGCFHSPMCGVNFSRAWALADVMSGTDGSFFFLAFSCLRFVAPVSTRWRRPLPNDERAVEQRVDGLPEVPGLDWGDIGPRGASMAMAIAGGCPAGAHACRGGGVRRGSDGGVAGRSLRVGTAAPASTRAVIVQAATESKSRSGGFGMPSGGRRSLLEAWLEGAGGVGRGGWVFQGGGLARAGADASLLPVHFASE